MAAIMRGVILLMWPVAMSTSGVIPNCTLKEFHGCMQELQAIDLDNAATRIELLSVCSTLKDTVQCVDHHMKHCFTPTQRKVFNQVVAGARQVLAELCVPGSIQEAYLKHAPCFRNASLQEDKCAKKYRKLIELSVNVKGKDDVDEGLRESCCAFRDFVMCKHFHATQDCGMEAGEFQQQHLDRISSPLIHEHCASYTYLNTCDHSSARTITGSVRLVALSMTTTTLLALRVLRNCYGNDIT